VTKQLDWLPLYWQRFLLGTLDMSAEEIGAYILLLIHQWDKGALPLDEKTLRKISKASKKSLENVLKKFEKTPEGLKNSVLEQVRDEQQEKMLKRSNSAASAAHKRWSRNATAMPTHSEGNAIREEERRVDKSESKHANAHTTTSQGEGNSEGQKVTPQPKTQAQSIHELSIPERYMQSEEFRGLKLLLHRKGEKVDDVTLEQYVHDFWPHFAARPVEKSIKKFSYQIKDWIESGEHKKVSGSESTATNQNPYLKKLTA
jgi:uncharacterized protein YdaU (DUF1376 family)